MKKFFLFGVAALGISALAIAGVTAPNSADSSADTLRKINTIENDARTGAYPLAVTSGTGVTAVVSTIEVVTGTTSSVAAGARSVQFLGTSGFTGVVSTGTFSGATLPSFTAPNGAVLGAIPYTLTTGTLYISTVR